MFEVFWIFLGSLFLSANEWQEVSIFSETL